MSWGHWKPLGYVLGGLGGVLEAFGGLFEAAWAVLGCLGRLLDALGRLLGAVGGLLGALGLSWAALGRQVGVKLEPRRRNIDPKTPPKSRPRQSKMALICKVVIRTPFWELARRVLEAILSDVGRA